MENIIDLFISLLFKPYSSGVYSDWSTSLSLGWNSVILQQHSCLVTVKEFFFFCLVTQYLKSVWNLSLVLFIALTVKQIIWQLHLLN